jgi:integrase
MPTFSQLPSGKWRVQVRRPSVGFYRAATFPTKAEARKWGTQVEAQADHAAGGGFAPVPREATVADLIDRYQEMVAKHPGKTKAATLAMLRDRLGKVRLSGLNAVALRDFIDRRVKDGAGGVTIAADLSFFSAVLKWGRHARQLDIPAHLALEARESLKHRGLETRSRERDREPTDEELAALYAHWRSKPRQRIDMPTICDFALATAWRLDEICRQQVEDIDRVQRTALIRDRKDPRNKAGNDQWVPLLPDAWAIAERLMEGRTVGQLFEGAKAGSVSTAFTRACTALEIDDLHFHDLRHRATAQLFRLGLEIPQVALMTGHKTWAMLRRYTEVKPADVHAKLAQAGKAPSAKPSRKTAKVLPFKAA